MTLDPSQRSDELLRFMFPKASARGQTVRLTHAWQRIQKTHEHLPAPVLALLGELTAAACLLASSLKFEGSVVLQIHGDDVVQLMVVDADSSCQVRAAVTVDAGRVAELVEGSAQSLLNRHGKGRFSLILDPVGRQPGTPPYQGIVSLQGDSIAAMLENYMLSSEQVVTRLWLQADAVHAAGLLLQRLPEQGGDVAVQPKADTTEDWNRLVHLASTVREGELLSTEPERMLHRLFWQEGLEALASQSWSFACRCSREKVAGMLRWLGRAEIDSVLAEQGSVEVRCRYCNQAYEFDAVDCAQLLHDTGPAPGGGSGLAH